MNKKGFDEIYIEGWNACKNGFELNTNPYADTDDWDSRRHWEWGFEGFKATFKI